MLHCKRFYWSVRKICMPCELSVFYLIFNLHDEDKGKHTLFMGPIFQLDEFLHYKDKLTESL